MHVSNCQYSKEKRELHERWIIAIYNQQVSVVKHLVCTAKAQLNGVKLCFVFLQCKSIKDDPRNWLGCVTSH
jgi:hypothetical protein